MGEPKQEPNVTKDGATVRIQRVHVVGAKADLAKKEIRLTLSITLDESSLAVRDYFAFWQFDETPIKVSFKPVRTQLGLPGVSGMTLEPDERVVAEEMSDDEDS